MLPCPFLQPRIGCCNIRVCTGKSFVSGKHGYPMADLPCLDVLPYQRISQTSGERDVVRFSLNPATPGLSTAVKPSRVCVLLLCHILLGSLIDTTSSGPDMQSSDPSTNLLLGLIHLSMLGGQCIYKSSPTVPKWPLRRKTLRSMTFLVFLDRAFNRVAG